MEFVTYKSDVWGREVIRGVSWDLLWLVVVAAFVAIALHAIYEAMQNIVDRNIDIPGGDLPKMAQMFADLNRHAIRTGQSLGIPCRVFDKGNSSAVKERMGAMA